MVSYPYVDEASVSVAASAKICPLNGEAGIIVIREGEERSRA